VGLTFSGSPVGFTPPQLEKDKVEKVSKNLIKEGKMIQKALW
jgi:hypothetical protein